MSKEKTPMQELIDKYEKKVKTTNSPSVEFLLEMVLEDIKDMNLLEKEKQMVVDACEKGSQKADDWYSNSSGGTKTAEQYYNDKYEQ